MSGEKSERGKYSVQIWQSDPMNSPKAFGELIKSWSEKIDDSSIDGQIQLAKGKD